MVPKCRIAAAIRSMMVYNLLADEYRLPLFKDVF